MPILLPNLDDRRWTDLVDEGRALIPLYAPEWTDQNVSDPGITLMELLALNAEMDIFALNRISDRARLKFLALVGIHPEPPKPAHTVLSFQIARGAAPLTLPAEVVFSGLDPFGVLTPFRTLDAIGIVPAQLAAVQVKDAAGFRDMTDRWKRGLSFGLFGDAPVPGAELYLGFDQPLAAGQAVSLFFILAGGRSGPEERRRILAEAAAQQEACVPVVPACSGAASNPQPGAAAPPGLPPFRGVRTACEILTASGWRALAAAAIHDDTRQFTLNGRLLLTPPQDTVPQTVGRVSAALSYLRVRLEAGSWDAPPTAQNVLMNAVAAEQAVVIATLSDPADGKVFIGTGDGTPGQQMQIPQAPVQQSSLTLLSYEDGGWDTWRLRPDFDASQRGDRDFLLDATAGAITFGAGEHGMTAPLGVQFFARFRTTRADAGNLPPGVVNALMDSPYNRAVLPDFDDVEKKIGVTNPVPAAGGTAAETLGQAIGRAVAMLAAPERAVTLQDYEALAMQTPGTVVARAKAWANLHPSFPCFEAPGMITLVILPGMPGRQPTPSLALRQAVATYLNRRRILGSRLEVAGPQYREVAVQAQVKALAGTSKTALQKRVVDALNQFFDPLSGGPEGTGWPFGRDVYRTEVMQVIDKVAGVDYVSSFDLLVDGCTCEPQCGNVCLAPGALVAAGPHQIEVL